MDNVDIVKGHSFILNQFLNVSHYFMSCGEFISMMGDV